MSHKPAKRTLTDLIKMKEEGTPAARVSAHDLPFAHAAERAGARRTRSSSVTCRRAATKPAPAMRCSMR